MIGSALCRCGSLTFALALSSLTGCGGEDESPNPASGGVGGAPAALESGSKCDGETTYEGFAKTFFESYCVGCHSSELRGDARHLAPQGFDYDTLAGAKAVGPVQLDRAVLVREEMPPSEPKPSAAERERFGAWLACGMP